jgi:hypothetical protein
MTRTKLFLLVSTLTILLAIFGSLYWWFNREEFGSNHYPELEYGGLKAVIQVEVTGYWIDNQEELPKGATSPIGTYNVTGVGTCYIIDVCQIITPEEQPFLGMPRGVVPDGFAKLEGNGNDNFDDPACNLTPSGSGQHYVWVVSEEEIVYSVCDENSDGVIEPNESTDGFSGSLLHKKDIWP